VVLLWTAAWADLPFKKKAQPVQTPSPQELAQTLRSGTAVQRNDLARELGILAPSNGAAKSTAPCVDFSHVEERKATLRAGDENVLLLADSTACDSLYLIVFDKAPKSEWRHVQTVRLTARRQRPEVSFVELVQPGVSEVVIHHGTTRDGGAVMQEDLLVLKMLQDRMETVLLTTEHSEITLANRQAGESDNLQQKQVSTFELLKPAPNSAATNRLLEKQVITDNKTTITRYRVWTWDPELERFRPAAFDGGDVRPAAPPKKPATAPTK
jgi:hypothetical protein